MYPTVHMAHWTERVVDPQGHMAGRVLSDVTYFPKSTSKVFRIFHNSFLKFFQNSPETFQKFLNLFFQIFFEIALKYDEEKRSEIILHYSKYFIVYFGQINNDLPEINNQNKIINYEKRAGTIMKLC